MSNIISVVSPFPPDRDLHGNKFSALASFCKNTLDGLLKLDKKIMFDVFADESEDGRGGGGKRLFVSRCWKRNSATSQIRLFINLLKSRNKKILWQFEWGMFGSNKLCLLLVPIIWILLSVFGKKLYIVSHGVLLDASKVSGQINKNGNKISEKIYSLALRFVYGVMLISSEKVIVLEEQLKSTLSEFTIFNINFGKKIITIPHGVEKSRYLNSKKRPSSSEFKLLNFGFINWYKGTDWLLENYSQISRRNLPFRTKLTIAGGKSNVHANDLSYNEYIEKSLKVVKGNPNIFITGYLESSEIEPYFRNSDLVILPYRVFLSSSGPLSLSLTYSKPVIFSENLVGYCKSSDFSEAMAESGLKWEDISFKYNNKSLELLITKVAGNKNLYKKMVNFSKLLASKRYWSLISRKYLEVLR